MKWLTPLLCCLVGVFFSSLYAKDEESEEEKQTLEPWTTGPLIAPAGVTVPQGQFVVQPYLFTGPIGVYSNHWKPVSRPSFYATSIQLLAQAGLNDFMDFQIFPQVLYNASQGESSLLFGDFPITLDFQLIRDDKFQWFPGIKLTLTETFPTGNYEKLNPKKRGTDISGAGSFATAPGLVFFKIYPLYGRHFLTFTASFAYTYSAPVSVKGLSIYGGDRNTRGKVYPGNLTTAILSFEYTLTQNWVLSLDNVYVHENKNRLRGNIETGQNQAQARAKNRSSEQLSFAPAIEYNFTQNFGLIAGVWFTAAGRNALKFCNGAISVVLTY